MVCFNRRYLTEATPTTESRSSTCMRFLWPMWLVKCNVNYNSIRKSEHVNIICDKFSNKYQHQNTTYYTAVKDLHRKCERKVTKVKPLPGYVVTIAPVNGWDILGSKGTFSPQSIEIQLLEVGKMGGDKDVRNFELDEEASMNHKVSGWILVPLNHKICNWNDCTPPRWQCV